jgi:hypothetical protein
MLPSALADFAKSVPQAGLEPATSRVSQRDQRCKTVLSATEALPTELPRRNKKAACDFRSDPSDTSQLCSI